MMHNTDCEVITELLPAYMAGQLDAKTRMAVAAHLAVCADCRNEAAAVLQIAKACEKAYPEPDHEFMCSAFKLLDSGNVPEPQSALEVLADAVGTARNALVLARKTMALVKL